MYRYLNNPTFRAELHKRQDTILSAVTAGLVGLSGKAIETLCDILDSETAGAGVKARAALGWLRQVRETVELQDLVQRLAVLEEKLEVEQ